MKPDGGVRNLYQYRPFGDWVIFEGPWIHHTFTGEDLFGSGLVALGPRYYDPELGRFLQPDPIVPNPADPQSLNPYSYVLNNPLNLVDPTGLQSERPPPRVTIEGPSIWEQTWDIWYYLWTPSPERPVTLPSTEGHVPNPAASVQGDTVRDPIVGETINDPENAIEDWILERVFGGWSSVEDETTRESRGKVIKGIGFGILAKKILDWFFSPEGAVDQTDPGIDAEESSDAPPSGRETGSYTNYHESGKTYHGKGDRPRSQTSGRREARRNSDPHIATDWTPAPTDREAFKQESRRLDQAGGSGDPSNYNRVESPGRRYREEDGELP